MDLYSSIDTLWVLLGAMLVFFMQAGFAMVETGFTRAKNAGNIIMKNLADFSIGTVAFWLIGFGLMFGGSGLFVGGLDFFIQGDYSGSFPTAAFVIFQTVFCATAATIVSGAMAERTKFVSYMIYAVIICAFIYPISGHWIWGGGWLAGLGFHDFAGSTAVHMVGGMIALVGAKIVGARIGKYTEDGKVHAIPGHSLTLGALGVFILWLAWFGFNGCSTLSLTGDEAIVSASQILLNTNMAAATSALGVLLITWIRYKKPDVSMTLNGALAGLVAITAGCDAVNIFGAFGIGALAAVSVVFGIEFIDRKLKIDDPVGAIGVHGVCGALGTILVGVFSLEEGLLYGGGLHAIAIQTIGVLAVAAWVMSTTGLVFIIIKKTIGLRVEKEIELAGLDLKEHGLISSYADFTMLPFEASLGSTPEDSGYIPGTSEPNPSASGSCKMTKLSIITEPSKFPKLKSAMEAIGVTGMTVTQVMGYGMQSGHTYYRGNPVEANLEPKVKVDIVVSKLPVEMMIEEIKKALYTGKIGDGKVFIYNVENVIKVRTGEENYAALQDVN